MTRESTDKRQEQIKKAVLKIITKEGLHNLSIRNLAKKVGITEGAIFRHFESKRAIIISILDDVKKDLMSELRSITQSTYSTEDRLYMFLMCHTKYLVKNKGVSILLFSEAAHLNYREVRKRFHSIISEQEMLISTIIKDGIKEGKWDRKADIEDIAILYRSIPISLNVEIVINEHDIAVKNFCKRMNNLFLKILRK